MSWQHTNLKFLNLFINNRSNCKKHFMSSLYNFTFVKLFTLKEFKFKDLYLSQLLFKPRSPLLLLWTVPFLSSTAELGESGQLNPTLVNHKKLIMTTIQEADEFFESNKYQEAISALLPLKESDDVEVLWRLGRAQYTLSKSSAVSDAEKRRLVEEAFTTLSHAMTVDDSHWAVHKWFSVLLDAHSAYEGIKARVTQLEKVKFHMLKAAELNPKDATTLYMLGSWCFQIADMSWMQRKIAAAIFAAPPISSYEEALSFFSKAEEMNPKFYSQNLLMLGKTLMKLKRQPEAVHYFSLARDYSGSSEEDDLVRKEAADVLKSLKV